MVGVGVAVEQAGAAARRRSRSSAIRTASRPSRDVGHCEERRGTVSDEQLAAADDLLPSISTVGSSDHAVEVDGNLHVAADRRRGAEGDVAVPRIFSSSRMLPVRVASSLVPIPSSATLVPSSPCAVSSSSSCAPSAPVASTRRPSRTVSVDRRLDHADAGDRAVDDERALGRALDGAMKPSPQGRLPKAPGA